MQPRSRSYKQTPDRNMDAEYVELDSLTESSKTNKYVRYGTLSKDGWGLEMLSSLTTVILFTGMVVIFCTMSNKAYSKWPFSISINAAISILSTGCTAAMMHNSSRDLYNIERFDQASRGPYGSMLFIFRVPWNIATLGAFITILRLGFSPFAQEVGLYDMRSVPLFECGGACVWRDSYISLGFKSTCENVTVSTLKTETCVGPHKQGTDFVHHCNMTTPGGIKLDTQYATDFLTTFRINATATTALENFNKPLADIARIAVYRSTWGDPFGDVNITECAVAFTAFEYSKAEANGSTFSFGKVDEIDIRNLGWSWEGPRTDFSLVSNKSTTPNLPQFKISSVEIEALQEFFQSVTFKSEFLDGRYFNTNSGLSAALAGGVDLPRAFDNMAAAMTEYIRSGPNMKLAQGVRRESELFVLVRWYWLIGPVLLELAALTFAIFSIVGTARKHEVPLWKSSALVLLNCRHNMTAGTIHGEFQDVKELERIARISKARLE
ncbi:hypothetical protein FLONG3_7179 [Fusarium longipes]|uniref:Uncharacterized protein n=1 Tax=Fusarium longipes TaxID=694270 RepID=A0A395SGL4_9HYPO|nr:hypothetical protein FLONG3_7179 [Fusarium longipes]